MKFARLGPKVVQAEMVNDVPMARRVEMVSLVVIALPVIVLHVMAKDVRRVMAKGEVRVMAKGDLRVVEIRTVDVNLDAAKDLQADPRAVQWVHRIQSDSWKMRCVLMPTPMASSARKN